MRAVAAFRSFFLVLGVASLLLGYLGFREYLKIKTGREASPADLVYYDLQLLVLDPTPFDTSGGYPWELEVARFGAPLAAAYAVAEAARALFEDQWRRARIKRLKGHAVVAGDGDQVDILATRLAEAGTTVVTVGSSGDARPHRRRFHIQGDARERAVHKAAGTGRAEAVYAFSSDGAANAHIALTAAGAPRKAGERLLAYVYVPDLDLCQALRARRLGASQGPDVRLDFFHPAELAARVLFDRRPETADSANIMVIGLSDQGVGLLLELVHRKRVEPVPGPRRLTLVDGRAAERARELTNRYPFLADWEIVSIEQEPVDFDLQTWARTAAAAERPDRVFFCDADPQVALGAALSAVALWGGRPSSLVVCVPRAAVYGEAFAGGSRLLDDLGGALLVTGMLDAACDPQLISDDLTEQLGRVFHERYVLARLLAGENASDNPSIVPWHELPEALRRSNYGLAAHVGEKLKAVGCLLAPTVGGAPAFAFTPPEIERLAKLEHRRWVAERLADGWKHGPVRDDEQRIHHALVDWTALPDEERQKDRDAVEALPDTLADAGFQIVRA